MFDPTKLYFANDPALNALAPYSTMAHWRCEGRGCLQGKGGKFSK